MKKEKKNEVISYAAMKRAALRDAEFRKEYEAIQPEFDVVRAVLDARLKKGLTQADIARRAGTTQSAIARFEAGRTNPTLDFASRVARAVGAKLEVRLAR